MLLGLLASFFGAGWAQDQGANAKSEQIRFDVSVTTKKGEWITGLREDDFKVYFDKQLLPIASFVPGDIPASVGVLIDKSGSTSKALISALPAAVNGLIRHSDTANEYFVMSFDEKQTLLLDFTQDPKAINAVIENLWLIAPKGNTNLYDSIRIGIDTLTRAKYRKRVLIVFTDARDNVSKLRSDEIKRLVQESRILLYTVNVTDPRQMQDGFSDVALRVMQSLTESSGGRYFEPKGPRELNETLEWTASDLRNRYLIGLETGFGSKGGKVEIRVDVPRALKSTEKPTVRANLEYRTQPTAN